MTFEEFMETGKFGCSNCYESFESKIDPILKNIHGANRHVGRLGEIAPASNLEIKKNEVISKDKTNKTKESKTSSKQSKEDKLKQELQKAIKEERYEDAAKLRDEIKKLEKN